MDDIEIDRALNNMNQKTKKKKKKFPEKFKNYSQEINENKNDFPPEYLNINSQLLNIDLNKSEEEIDNEFLNNFEKFSLNQIRLLLDDEIENILDNPIPKKYTDNEIENLIKNADEVNIENYEKMDIEEPNENLENNNIVKKDNYKSENDGNLNDNIINLNEKYGFNKHKNFFKEIEFIKLSSSPFSKFDGSL